MVCAAYHFPGGFEDPAGYGCCGFKKGGDLFGDIGDDGGVPGDTGEGVTAE